LFGIVDIFWVAKLGEAATAGVGVTESMLTVVYGIAMGVSMATTAMVARRTGEKDDEGAARAAAQSILLGLILSAAIALPGAFLAPQLLTWMGSEPAVVAASADYTIVIFMSAPSIMLLFLMNAIFRGAGDAMIAMRVLWTANLINIALDPLLIYGFGPVPAMGVAGAAWATAIGRSCGVLLQLLQFARHKGRLHISRRHFAPAWTILRRLSRVSATGTLQFLIAQASWIALIRVIATSGSAALAGYTIAIRIIIFSILPSWGLSNAAATLVGQNLGARHPERAESSVWRVGLYNMVFLGALSIIFLAVPRPLVALFTENAEVIRHGADCLRVLSYGYVFYAYGMVLVQAFNGAGDTTTPTMINIFCYWAVQIPLAWLLGVHLGLGAYGAYWAVPTAEGLLAVVGIWVFRQGRWKKQVI
ncbi:MAG: MATE family efflux transporter, partial [Bryobacter sp.]|nr:MATE family efflux transporter [Bryobacter sp.]